MAKLSSLSCDTAKPDPKRDRLLGDGDGLYLRVRPHGTKTWVIDYEHLGRRRKYTIGVYWKNGAPGESISDWLHNGQLSLAQARSIAGAWKSARRAGRDPVIEWEALLSREKEESSAKDEAINAERKLPTLNQAAEEFVKKCLVGKKSAAAVQYRIERICDILGAMKIRDITKSDVISAIDTIAAGKRGKPAKQLAGEVLTTAKRLWRFAEDREMLSGASPIEKLTRKTFDAKPNKRNVVLRFDEIATLWSSLSDPQKCRADPITIAAIKIIILTGQRENEVCRAQWSEIDFKEALWRLPDNRTKSDRAHLVHLAPLALEIFTNLKRITGAGHYVFPSPLKPEQPIYGRSVNNALLSLYKRGALENVTKCTIHDLRRTLITRLPDLGFEPFIGHKIANQVLSGVFAHYNHNSYEKQRKAGLIAWARKIETLTKRKLHMGCEL